MLSSKTFRSRPLRTARKIAIKAYLAARRIRNHLARRFHPQKVYYAEFNTDKFLRENFFPDISYKGLIVEVGCATPELLSMSKHFRDNGWSFIGIDPNPNFIAMHRKVGNEVYQYAAADYNADDVEFTIVESSSSYDESNISAHSYSALEIRDEYQAYNNEQASTLPSRVIKVQVRTLDSILNERRPPVTSIDILSIDVEGFELDVMRGLQQHQPQVVVLENLFHKDEYVSYMAERGYRLAEKLKYNYIFCLEKSPGH